MNVLFWWPGDFPESYSNRDTSWNVWHLHSASCMVDTGILFSNMKYPSQECLMIFWPLTSYSGIRTDQTFHQFMALIPSLTFTELRVVSMEHLQRVWLGSENAYHSGHLVPSHFWWLVYAPIADTSFSELAVSFLDFSPWIPLGTFSILLHTHLRDKHVSCYNINRDFML